MLTEIRFVVLWVVEVMYYQEHTFGDEGSGKEGRYCVVKYHARTKCTAYCLILVDMHKDYYWT